MGTGEGCQPQGQPRRVHVHPELQSGSSPAPPHLFEHQDSAGSAGSSRQPQPAPTAHRVPSRHGDTLPPATTRRRHRLASAQGRDRAGAVGVPQTPQRCQVVTLEQMAVLAGKADRFSFLPHDNALLFCTFLKLFLLLCSLCSQSRVNCLRLQAFSAPNMESVHPLSRVPGTRASRVTRGSSGAALHHTAASPCFSSTSSLPTAVLSTTKPPAAQRVSLPPWV